MAVFNGEAYIRPALDSLLRQTFADFELIVIDDGSVDRTPQIVAEYAAKDRRIVPLRNDANKGLLYSRTRAFRESRAPFVAVADADDVFEPTRFEKQIAYMRTHPEVGFSGCGAQLVNEAGEVIGENVPPSEHRHIRFLSLLGSCMWDTSTIYRGDVLQAVGWYDASVNGGGLDYDLWARLMDVTECHNLPDVLVKVRVHQGSYTSDLGGTLANQVRVARRLLAHYLNRSIPVEDATAALTLFTHGWRVRMTPAAIARAVLLLRTLRRAAIARESQDTQDLFRVLAARAMLQQAGIQIIQSRAFSLKLLCEALRWHPGVARSRRFVSYALRFVTPGSTRAAVALRRRGPSPAS
jgi:cellulose synthase/poly-beta-1,6-N-acetylglucosamine synthase-like glycosyltransferase